MDTEAKHYRSMKNAVWLFLYLLVNANRGTGVLIRKHKTISADMGVSRDMVLRWMNVLRKGGYITTANTGRYLAIQVRNWRPVGKWRKIQLQKSGESDSRSRKYPNSPRPAFPPIPVHSDPKPAASRAANDTKIQIIFNNQMQHTTAFGPSDDPFQSIGACAKHELLAWDLAKALDDADGIRLYRVYSQRYSEELLRKVLDEVQQVPVHRIKRSRAALFVHLVQHYAKGATTNPGD